MSDETDKSSNKNSTNPVEDEEDIKCKNILKNKDYYNILSINNKASEEEIKRAYKKIIVKYHPDKNKSKYSSETFKKINHVYQILSDINKRELYDEFGTANEDELRDILRKSTNNNKEYNFENMNEFDLFDLIFNNINNNSNKARFKRRNEENLSPLQKLIQSFFPLILMFLFYGLPYILDKDNNDNKTNSKYYRDYYNTNLFAFDIDNNKDYYQYDSFTINNKVKYYYDDNLKNFYNKIHEDIEEINEYSKFIEHTYLNKLAYYCNEVLKKKKNIQEKLSSTTVSYYYKEALNEELDDLDYSYCDMYEDFKSNFQE